jgi:orotate phosphoribosyltransferase
MQLIKQKGIVVLNYDITLSSGEKSNYYYDLRRIALDPKGLDLLGGLLFEEVSKKYDARSVGGLEAGAIPISASIVMKSSGGHKDEISGFYVRKQPKLHGLQKKIEGYLIEPIVIVYDVLTKGSSVMQALEAVMNEGFNVAGVVCVIDREDKTPNYLIQNNIKYSSLFKHSDFKSFIDEEIKKKQKLKTQSLFL